MEPGRSPFAPTLERYRAGLPAAFQVQFLVAPEDGYDVVLEGTMDRIWRRHSWLWPLFRLFALADMLFPETGIEIPTTNTITAHRQTDGRVYHRWNRIFGFPRPRHFDGLITYDDARRTMVEGFGPGHRIEIDWRVRFNPPSTLDIRATGWALRLGFLRLPFPTWLLGTGKAIQIADAKRESVIRMALTVRHPLLGAVFGYEGTFTITRHPHSRQKPDG